MALFFALLMQVVAVICNHDHATITIFEVATDLNNSIHGNVAGHFIAIDEINNNPDLLPNYTLNLQGLSLCQFILSYNLFTVYCIYLVKDAQAQSSQIIIETINMIDFTSNETQIYFPLVLGPLFSSLTAIMNPILGAYNKGQIGVGTSMALSDPSQYPYFYRYDTKIL